MISRVVKPIFTRMFDFLNYPGINPDEREKRRIAVLAFVITAAVMVPFAIYNFIISSYTTAMLNAVTSTVMLFIFLLLRFIEDGKKIYRVGAAFLGYLFLFNIATGGPQGGLVFWSFIFPLGTFFMLGIIEGFIWNLLFLLLALSVMFASHYVSEIFHYSFFFMWRFALSYTVVSLLTIGYESARSATLAALIQKQKKLNSSYNRMKIELELSKKIQKNIIPGTPPEFSGLQIASLCRPLGAIGGDFYDYILMTNPRRLGFFISDVAGHGVPSALITSMLKILLATSGKHREQTSEMLFYMNKHLYEKSGGYLTTAFYGIYDPAKMTLSYSRGGHCFPYLIHNGNTERLTADGYILGAKKNPVFESKKVQLQKGDKVLLFTDGLIEAFNREFVTFESVISEVLIKHAHRGVSDFVKNVFNECSSFVDGNTLEDDISIIGIEVTSSTRERHTGL